MAWDTEIPLIVRSWINDLSDTPTYSDDRVLQLIVVAAQYVINEVEFTQPYTIDIVDKNITPDPTTLADKDVNFIGMVSLKASCILDQSTLRTRAASEGIRASLGPANLTVGGSLRGYETILAKGPCSIYEKVRDDFVLGRADFIKAILGPFVGNKFDGRYLDGDHIDGNRSKYFYS